MTENTPQDLPDCLQFKSPAMLPSDSDMELIGEVVVECTEHLDAAQQILLELEDNPEDPELLNTVFRAFHTIKGSSSFLGLDRIQRLAHLAENILSRARTGDCRVVGTEADATLESCDLLQAMLNDLEKVEPGDGLTIPDAYDPLILLLSELEEGYQSNKEGSAATDVPELVIEESAVEEDDLAPGPEPGMLGEILVEDGVATPRQVASSIEHQLEGDERPIGEILVAEEGVDPKKIDEAARNQLKEQQEQQQQKKKDAAAKGNTQVRVGLSNLDGLIDMVGELVIAHSLIEQDPDAQERTDSHLNGKISHLGKITRELQDLSMALRMVPLRPTFERMRRVARDLGRKSGKAIRVVMEGDDTEIDRNMVEGITDPLVHMIRNSADHGIESAEDRVACGKPETGTLTLRAYRAAGNVIIEVQDNGKGLDRDKILAKAIDNGLVQADRKMDDGEIYELIFSPGLSTAKKVTDVSGRGVGMDVVKKSIDALRGNVSIDSELGKGTTMKVSLPLTMAIADSMLLVVGKQRYLLPTQSIQQSYHPTPDSITTVVGKGEMVMFRGELVPIVRLHSVFDIPDAQTEIGRGLLIVIEINGKRCALLADGILGQHQVVIKALGPLIGKITGLAGGAILGDGHVGLIIDPQGVATLSRAGADQGETWSAESEVIEEEAAEMAVATGE